MQLMQKHCDLWETHVPWKTENYRDEKSLIAQVMNMYTRTFKFTNSSANSCSEILEESHGVWQTNSKMYWKETGASAKPNHGPELPWKPWILCITKS